MMSGGPLLTPV